MSDLLILLNSLLKKANTPQEKEAVEELPTDLKNERRLARDVNQVDKEMENEVFIFLLAFSTIPNLEIEFTPEMQGVLRRNYRKISRDYKENLRVKLGISKEALSSEVNQAISAMISNESKLATSKILNTKQKDLIKAFQKVQLEHALAGTTPTRQEFAKQVKSVFKDFNKGRLKTIAQTEVAKISNTVKQIEAEKLVLAGEVEGIATRDLVKEWVAILDSKTREAHSRADGQQRNIKEPYDVGGERLMYPVDSSLGATAKNIINCRCKSVVVQK